MSSDLLTSNASEEIIELIGVSKKFQLYDRPIDRLKEILHPRRRRLHHEHWALKDLSFTVAKGETIGVMGRNGAGKSTLLQLITSVLEPSAGQVRVRGRISALLELGAGFNPEMTGRENVLAQAILMGMTRREMVAKLPEIAAFADIGEYFDQPVRSYSSGMFVRLAFAMFISVKPDILIIDEALAVGDAAFQEKCFRKLKELKENGATFILVSHSASLISDLCDRVLIIEKGGIYFEGDTQTGLVEYGKLMFSSLLPNDAEAALKRAVTEKSSMPDDHNAKDLGEWAASAFSGEEKFPAGVGYNKNEIRNGNYSARIVDYRVLAGEKSVTTPVLDFQQEISIYFKVFYEKEIPRPRFAFTISTLTGVLVYDVNTVMKGFIVPAGLAGQTTVYRFAFKNLLAKGNYVLSLWLVEEHMDDVYRVDSRESSIILESRGSDTFQGLVDLNASIERLSPSATSVTSQ